MNLILKGPVTDEWLRAIMTCVFNDYLRVVTTEEFQKRFGIIGTEALTRNTEPDDSQGWQE
jgi:hypothetical protein